MTNADQIFIGQSIAGIGLAVSIYIATVLVSQACRKACAKKKKAGCGQGYPTEEKALELHQRPVSRLESQTHLKFKLVNGLRAANEAQWDRDVERYHKLKHSHKLWTMEEAEFLIKHCHNRGKRLAVNKLRNLGL